MDSIEKIVYKTCVLTRDNQTIIECPASLLHEFVNVYRKYFVEFKPHEIERSFIIAAYYFADAYHTMSSEWGPFLRTIYTPLPEQAYSELETDNLSETIYVELIQKYTGLVEEFRKATIQKLANVPIPQTLDELAITYHVGRY